MATEWTPTPQSSNVVRVGYDDETQELTVEFKGGSYTLTGVSKQGAADFAADSSPGAYYNRHLKNRYPTRKL